MARKVSGTSTYIAFTFVTVGALSTVRAKWHIVATMDLPPPKPSQPFVDVSVLEAGNIVLPEYLVIKGGSMTKSTWVPSLAFLLVHSQSGKKIIFDLGLRKDWEAYPPATVQGIKSAFQVDVPVDIVESLRHGGAQPDDVDTVILSHVHFDHIGNPSLFPRSHFVVGHAAKKILASGYSADDAEPALSARFAKHLLPESRTSYLPTGSWKPLGPFPLAHDLFGDGSVYLIDAPGHLQGHINALVRTSADGGWLYLAGDSAHDKRIMSGECEIGKFSDPVTGNLRCMHIDVDAAKGHIERIRRLCGASSRVLMLLAHDKGWFDENRDKGVVFPGKIAPL